VYLTPEEAEELLGALTYWSAEDRNDPEWHLRITDAGRELTIGIGRDAAKGNIDRGDWKPS
jgi:hypothetical protein